MPVTRRVLIVDPGQAMAPELVPGLVSLGYEVSTLREPEEAGPALGYRWHEVALFNVTGLGRAWRPMLAGLKRGTPTTSFVAMAQSADESELRRAMGAGAFAAVDTPIPPDGLRILVSPDSDGLFVLLRG